MSIITCNICKFWERDDGENLGQCSNDKFIYGYRFEHICIGDDQMLVENDEGWGFFTGPLFGCIHGEAAQKGNR